MQTPSKAHSLLRNLVVAAAVLSVVPLANASPYASCLTNNNGTVQFVMNEDGATVNVVFEDNTTNAMGVLPAGPTNFSLGTHTSYRIICTKAGNGTPSQISSDSAPFAGWNVPRGVDVNKNPKFGNLFGRVYTGNDGANATRQWGLYALTPDLSSNALGLGTNAMTATVKIGSTWVGQWALDANAGSTTGPYRMTVAPDNSLYVTDFGTPGGTLWQFGPNFEFTNLVLYPVGEDQGIAAGIHGDPIGVFISGSTATGDLKIYTADPGLGAPATAQLGVGGEGPTQPGDYNDLFRYDIGAGPLPWSNAPNLAVSVGLPGFFDSQIVDMTVETNGYLVGMFRRLNFSDGCIQVFDPSGQILYTSLKGTAPNQSDVFQDAYAGVRISPDGRFLATMTRPGVILIANLTNGIPDESSLLTIPDNPLTPNSRGIAWDSADNLYVCSSGQGLLRAFSLGITSTTITANDSTGTNGSFQLILPNTTATVAATQPVASQNYGSPIPGVFTIGLSQSTLAGPVTVSFTRSGTATYPTNYTINIGTNTNGVIISSNSVTFPAGTFPGGGNWSADVQIIPTATPVVGPTLTVGLRLKGGINYVAGTPINASLAIANTGPQLLVLSPASVGSTMNREVPNDYAEFVVTRLGDTNGPGNSAGNVVPKSYTVTNFTYMGTAVFPVDYMAQAQKQVPGSNPVNGTPGIVINPGDVTVTALIGNPVAHANLNLPPTNVTVVINLTNSATGTNLTSLEGYPYSAGNNAVTLTEIDNTVGPEVVLWSNPLTNALDSTNWTVTFASTNMGANPVLPVVIHNYTNGVSTIGNGETNDFSVQFGNPVGSDGVSPSPVMAAHGWNTALRMTVNKSVGSSSGVNAFPQGLNFKGNYALRFNMYLSLYDFARGTPAIGTASREFAAFGINHFGTNCDWRLPTTILAGTGASPTNADGIWFAIDAGTGSLTPADFDGFASPAIPNSGVNADLVSNTVQSQNGVFKNPPFTADELASGGSPVNQWVDVSVEVTQQTNVSLLINRSQVLSSFSLLANGGNYTNGTVMLGYLDPVSDVSDNTAFAYYSNVRVVELSPYISAQPSGIAALGGSAFLTASATYATAPITNTWYLGGTAPAVPLKTDTANATNLTSTLTVTNFQAGTNYFAVFSDAAGSVTSLVANVTMIGITPAAQTALWGSTASFTITNTGTGPLTYQWMKNGANLSDGGNISGSATNVLTISSLTRADAATYTAGVTNAAGGVISSGGVLTVSVPAPTFSGVSVAGGNATLSFHSTDSFDTTSAFILQSSPVVTGPYTNTPASFTLTNGTFQVTVPQASSNMFYRLLHVN